MMQDMMITIFGNYVSVDGGTNWEYVGSVVIFCICLYSLFRLVGMVFKR